MGLQRRHPDHRRFLSIESSGMTSTHCAHYSQASSPSRSRLGDCSNVDSINSTIVANLLLMLRRMDHQSQQIEINLVRIIATLLETPWPLFDSCMRQSIRQATSLSILVVLAGGVVVIPLDHTDSVARLCVALAQSERSSPARRRRTEAEIAEPVSLRA